VRILAVTHQYRPAIGGAEQYITTLCEELVTRGHQVIVLTSRSRDYLTWKAELARTEELAGVHVQRFTGLVRGKRTWKMLAHGYRGYLRTRSRLYEPLIYLGNGPVCPGLFWSVLRQAPRCDLVHISNLHYAHSATAYVAAKARRLPVVLTPHIHVEQPATYDVGYMRAMLRGSDHVLTDTAAEREFLIEAGLDHQRITVGGAGIRLEQFPLRDKQTCRQELGLAADATVLLFLGRKTEYKGLDIALEAFVALQAQAPKLVLLAVGPETDYSRALWDRYAGLPGVINHGVVSDETRVSMLNACDCLVLPSTGEAFGIVFLEAWAVGKPVIAVRTRSVSSVIGDGWDGYLISPGSASQLAERLLRWVQNPALAEEMGRRGRAKVLNRYSVPRITDVIEGAYLRVLRRSSRHRKGSGLPSAQAQGAPQASSAHQSRGRE